MILENRSRWRSRIPNLFAFYLGLFFVVRLLIALYAPAWIDWRNQRFPWTFSPFPLLTDSPCIFVHVWVRSTLIKILSTHRQAYLALCPRVAQTEVRVERHTIIVLRSASCRPTAHVYDRPRVAACVKTVRRATIACRVTLRHTAPSCAILRNSDYLYLKSLENHVSGRDKSVPSPILYLKAFPSERNPILSTAKTCKHELRLPSPPTPPFPSTRVSADPIGSLG